MALTEHEQELLAQIERGLAGQDKAVAPVPNHLPIHRVITLGAVGISVGLLLVLGGLLTKIVPISVLGFLAIVGTLAIVTAGAGHRVRMPTRNGRTSNTPRD